MRGDYVIKSITMACTLKAEYKSPVDPKDHLTEEITKGVSALRVLSPAARECLITEAMGLLFSPSHNSAYQIALKKRMERCITRYTMMHNSSAAKERYATFTRRSER